MRSAFISDADARTRITKLFFEKVLRDLNDKAARTIPPRRSIETFG